MRSFIAIGLSDEVKKELGMIQDGLKASGADVKWADPDNIHITLKFLGEVSQDKIAEINDILERVAEGYASFDVSLFKVGAFPDFNYPRVIWVGIDQNCAMVEEIAEKIENECEKIGFPREKRAFSAHLTLGRIRSQRNKPELKEKMMTAAVRPLASNVKGLTFFKSDLRPDGAVYTSIHIANLK